MKIIVDGNIIRFPGTVKFDTGNDSTTGISNELVDSLGLEPDHSKKVKVSLPGGGVLQCSRVNFKLRIRKRRYKVENALVGAVAPGTDLLIGMDIIQKLNDNGFTLGV